LVQILGHSQGGKEGKRNKGIKKEKKKRKSEGPSLTPDCDDSHAGLSAMYVG
jgi:hypothetical protein